MVDGAANHLERICLTCGSTLGIVVPEVQLASQYCEYQHERGEAGDDIVLVCRYLISPRPTAAKRTLNLRGPSDAPFRQATVNVRSLLGKAVPVRGLQAESELPSAALGMRQLTTSLRSRTEPQRAASRSSAR